MSVPSATPSASIPLQSPVGCCPCAMPTWRPRPVLLLLLLLQTVMGRYELLLSPPEPPALPDDAPQIPIYYINLDRRRDRKGLMEMMLAAQPHTRIPATTALGVRRMLDEGSLVCSGKLVSRFQNRTDFIKRRDSTFSFTEAATTHSHLSAIRRAYENGDDLALILEDDVECVRSHREVLLFGCAGAVVACCKHGPHRVY